MQNIVPLDYELKKAKEKHLDSDSIYEGMIFNYTQGNIGPISNKITKIWNNQKIEEEQLNVIRWLTFYNNAVIDSAKTLWLPEPPKNIKEIIKKNTNIKLPNFFIYAKDKKEYQVNASNNSTMNRIAKKIPNSKIIFSKSINKFDYRILMDLNFGFDLSNNNIIIQLYDYYNKRLSTFKDEDKNKGIKNQDMYKYKNMREKIIEESGEDIKYIVNTLVAYLYTVRKTSAKKGLWDCFGDVMIDNIQNNLDPKSRICIVCGRRFIPKNMALHTLTCSEKCSLQLKNQRKKEKRNSE